MSHTRRLAEASKFILKEVRRFHKALPGSSWEELNSDAHEGLIQANQRFDASRGTDFLGYACKGVRGSMARGIGKVAPLPPRIHRLLEAPKGRHGASRLMGPRPKPESAADVEMQEDKRQRHIASMADASRSGLLSTSVYDPDEDTYIAKGSDISPEAQTERRELLLRVAEKIEGLPKMQATIIRRHFLGGEELRFVAKELGITRSQATRLHKRGTDLIRKELE